MDVRFPSGLVVNNVPDGYSQAQLLQQLKQAGYTDNQLGLTSAQVQPETPKPENYAQADATAADLQNKLDAAHAAIQPSYSPYVQGMRSTNQNLGNSIHAEKKAHNAIPVVLAITGTQDSGSALSGFSPYKSAADLTPADVESAEAIQNLGNVAFDTAAWATGEGAADLALSGSAKYAPEAVRAVAESRVGKPVFNALKTAVTNTAGSAATDVANERTPELKETLGAGLIGAGLEGGGRWLTGGGKQGERILEDQIEALGSKARAANPESHEEARLNTIKQFGNVWSELRETNPTATQADALEYWKLKQPDLFKSIDKRNPLVNEVKSALNGELKGKTPSEIVSYAEDKGKGARAAATVAAEQRLSTEEANVWAEANRVHRESDARMKGSMVIPAKIAHTTPLGQAANFVDSVVGVGGFLDSALKNKNAIGEASEIEGAKDLLKRVKGHKRRYENRLSKVVDKPDASSKAATRVYRSIIRQADRDIDMLNSAIRERPERLSRTGNARQREYNHANEERYKRKGEQPLSRDLHSFVDRYNALRLAKEPREPQLYKGWAEWVNDALHAEDKSNLWEGAKQLATDAARSKAGMTLKAALGIGAVHSGVGVIPLVAGVAGATAAGKLSKAFDSKMTEKAYSLAEQVRKGTITEDEAKSELIKFYRRIASAANVGKAAVVGAGLKSVLPDVHLPDDSDQK